jgi:hypothetical protein
MDRRVSFQNGSNQKEKAIQIIIWLNSYKISNNKDRFIP